MTWGAYRLRLHRLHPRDTKIVPKNQMDLFRLPGQTAYSPPIPRTINLIRIGRPRSIEDLQKAKTRWKEIRIAWWQARHKARQEMQRRQKGLFDP